VERLGEYYQPDGPGLRRLSERQILDYLIYLRDDQKLAASTVNQALVAVRFLYRGRKRGRKRGSTHSRGRKRGKSGFFTEVRLGHDLSP
jgi:hypothetical protein